MDITRKLDSLSVFFPCYNDAGTIGKMVEDAISTLEMVTDNYEVIVVNDASFDYSREVLTELEKKYPPHLFRVIDHEVNRDYGGALQSGFSNCTKDLVFYTDGDGQYDVKELLKLIPLLTDGISVINGFKVKREDSWYRVMIGRLYRWTVKMAFNIKINDIDCDFRLLRREVIDKVKLKSTSGIICVEMMKKIQNAGFKIAQVQVNHYPRIYGESQCFQSPRVWRMLKALPLLWWELIILRRF
jgi:glycosyltransferase involved in cell wall biosynthesis